MALVIVVVSAVVALIAIVLLYRWLFKVLDRYEEQSDDDIF